MSPANSPLSRPAPRALLAFAALALLAACQAETAPAPEAVQRPVQVQRVVFENANNVRDFVGVVRARYESDLGFRVAGKVVARPINVGDRVRAGATIARLDAQDLQLQVESAEAELAAASSSLAQTAADFERYATLRARGYASVADFDRKKAANDEAQGRIERAKRALELARNQLGYAELRADADGVITATLAEPGQVVAVGQPVARLAHRGEKEAVIALPETWLADAAQAKATARLWSDRDRSFEAHLRELSPQADPATRTYAARFTITGADDAVAFGMTATVTLARAADATAARSAALGDPQSRERAGGLRRRRLQRTGLEAGDGRRFHREHGSCHLWHRSRRDDRDAGRAEAPRRPQGSHPRTSVNEGTPW